MKGLKILEEVRQFLDDPSYSRFVEINRAYRKICKLTDFNWLRKTDETAITFQASESNYVINMSNIRVLEGVYVKGGNDARWKLLEEAPPLLFENEVRRNQDLNATDNTSKPLFYKLEGGPHYTMEVTPTPDQAYSVRLNFIESTPEIKIDTEVNLPSDYMDTVAMLSAGYVLERSTDQQRQQYGFLLIGRATGEFESLTRDSHKNRTQTIDRTPQTWMK